MKKLLILLASTMLLVLAACGGTEEKKEVNDTTKQASKTVKEDEPTQEELDAKLKEEATDADFVELNVDNPPADKKVKATGEVSFIDGEGVGSTFTLTTKEGDGYGMYNINNFTLDDVKEGDQVTIYGTTKAEKSDDGMPIIVATIIEQN